MNIFILLATVVALTSCNTLIGLGRDTKEGYNWTKSKFQGSSQQGDPSGAPVY